MHQKCYAKSFAKCHNLFFRFLFWTLQQSLKTIDFYNTEQIKDNQRKAWCNELTLDTDSRIGTTKDRKKLDMPFSHDEDYFKFLNEWMYILNQNMCNK